MTLVVTVEAVGALFHAVCVVGVPDATAVVAGGFGQSPMLAEALACVAVATPYILVHASAPDRTFSRML